MYVRLAGAATTTFNLDTPINDHYPANEGEELPSWSLCVVCESSSSEIEQAKKAAIPPKTVYNLTIIVVIIFIPFVSIFYHKNLHYLQ